MKKSRKLLLSTSLVFMGLMVNVGEGKCAISFNFFEGSLGHKLSSSLKKVDHSILKHRSLALKKIASKFVNFFHPGNILSCEQEEVIKEIKNSPKTMERYDKINIDNNVIPVLNNLSHKSKISKNILIEKETSNSVIKTFNEKEGLIEYLKKNLSFDLKLENLQEANTENKNPIFRNLTKSQKVQVFNEVGKYSRGNFLNTIKKL